MSPWWDLFDMEVDLIVPIFESLSLISTNQNYDSNATYHSPPYVFRILDLSVQTMG
jgi:hypothetical protein